MSEMGVSKFAVSAIDFGLQLPYCMYVKSLSSIRYFCDVDEEMEFIFRNQQVLFHSFGDIAGNIAVAFSHIWYGRVSSCPLNFKEMACDNISYCCLKSFRWKTGRT